MNYILPLKTGKRLHVEVNENIARVTTTDPGGKPTKVTSLDISVAYSLVLAEIYLEAHGKLPTDIASAKALGVRLINFLEDATGQKPRGQETIEYLI